MQFEIGLLFGSPLAWVPAIEKYDGENFDGFSVMWLFVALMLRVYKP